MVEWLLGAIDPSRPHEVAPLVAWHGRLMVFTWSVAIPLGVLAARFGKVWPGQNWPQELDNKTWWRAHLMAQNAAAVAAALALALIVAAAWSGDAPLHRLLGWAALALLALQILSGWMRGSKGGPTAPDREGGWRGDHYDMTRRRVMFEYWHKTAGYAALMLALAATVSGMWAANAPRWMWLGLAALWTLHVGVFIALQRAGRSVDTYQAIWGVSRRHPGNLRRPIGFGIVRHEDPDQSARTDEEKNA